MKLEKEIKEMLKDSEDCCIIATKHGVKVTGYNSEILTLLTMTLKAVKECEGVEEKDLERALELSKLDSKELQKQALNKLKKLIEEMENK